MRNKNNTNTTKRLTTCAMLGALGVIFLYIGSLIEVLDISMAVFASLLCIIAVIEYGKSFPWMIYGVTSILSLLILPNKTPAAFYAIFFGFYPILKEKFEKLPKVVSWLLKEVVFNVCLAVVIVVAIFLLLGQNNALITPLNIAILALLAEVVFVAYDIALTRLISFYIIHIRKRLNIK